MIHSRITNKINDGFTNVHKMVGSKRDITTNTTYLKGTYLSQNYQLTNGLYTNWIGGKAVDIPINDAFRGGREFICEDQERIQTYKDYIKEIDLDSKLKSAMKWGNAFGDAVAIIISNDDEMSEPLILDNVKQGDIKDIIVLDRWQLYTMDINRDPLSSNFLNPKYFYVTRSSTPIHHSRVIRFTGLETTLYDKEIMNGWGLSVYERVYKEIQNSQMSPDLLINLLVQSNLDVFGIKGLNNSLTTGNDDLVFKRLEAILDGKSIYQGMALDSEDTYTNISKSFAGLSDIHNVFINILCGALDIPKTRFMGEQNSGLANDGSGDLKNYYDRIEANERQTLRNSYDQLDKLLTKSLFGEVLEFEYMMKPLFQMTESQEAEIRSKNAQTNQIYLNNGVIDELEAKETLVGDKYYSTITTESIEEYKKEIEEIESIEDPFSYEEPKEEEPPKQESEDKKIIDTIKEKLGL
jgi:phage-related protein (TIGR01555 family)